MQTVHAHVAAHGATTVRRLHVRIGELSGVDPHLLASAFDTFREPICRDAEMQIVHEAAAWVCPTCGAAIPRGGVLRCDACDTPAVLNAGQDIFLDRIEMEIPDV